MSRRPPRPAPRPSRPTGPRERPAAPRGASPPRGEANATRRPSPVSGPAQEAVLLIHPGLEAVLAEELTALGLTARIEPGGVVIPATWEALDRVHRWSWVAGRVLVRLGKVQAANLDQLGAGVRALPWRRVLHPRQPVEVEPTAKASKLWRADMVERKVQVAIADAMRGPREEGPRPPWQPLGVHVRIEGDHAVVSADASGDRLHRRGWREQTAKAPIRENLAAAVLRIAGWDPLEALVDPMCGAGTFVIEAARRAAGLTPRLADEVAWHRFPGARRSPDRPPVRRPMPTLVGADRDPGAIRASVGNARRAGVDGAVQFLECPFESLDPPATSGLVVANAPYGDRVGSAQTLPWERWGALLDGRWSGWRFAWLVPGDLDPRRLGGQTVARFENGGIPVQLVCGG